MNEVIINKAYAEANRWEGRYKVLKGGAGSGKSYNTALDYILKLSNPKYRGCSLLVVRGAENTHEQSTFSELRKMIYKLNLQKFWEIKTFPLSMFCTLTENSIIFRGANDSRAIERLRSMTVFKGEITWAWIEEATELTAEAVDTIDDRLRGELSNPSAYYQITMTFNPVSASHWIKSKFWDMDDPRIFRLTTTYLDNKFNDEEYIRRREREKLTDPERYRIYGLGEWGEVGGLIFPNIEIGNYKASDFDRLSLGADWGFTHYTAILLVGFKGDNVYILREVAVQDVTTATIIDVCEDSEMPKNITMYCDSAEPDRILQFREAGFKAVKAKKGAGSKKQQISWLKQRKIFIDKSCSQSIYELQKYQWKKNKITGKYVEEACDFDDDAISALRYAIEPWQRQKRLKTFSKDLLGL